MNMVAPIYDFTSRKDDAGPWAQRPAQCPFVVPRWVRTMRHVNEKAMREIQ
jgi:hypothetical protein